ncbi:hypothetical protein QU577_19245 [Priestia megaterium]|uniref:hypothetical protein n=1 Tax=Priestia megaterium TaxID=1404 RepID=UPI0025AEDB7E|nr:hypothetical protein [Priestia megaterium]MDN3363907.1 hypothetical protein [Priestia megaterium]WKU25176.1 hypothetical protein Q3A90_10045 [Priestia megaterium]
MYVITCYVGKSELRMYEFDSKEEAFAQLKKLKGCTILSEVVYFNDSSVIPIAI